MAAGTGKPMHELPCTCQNVRELEMALSGVPDSTALLFPVRARKKQAVLQIQPASAVTYLQQLREQSTKLPRGVAAAFTKLEEWLRKQEQKVATVAAPEAMDDNRK